MAKKFTIVAGILLFFCAGLVVFGLISLWPSRSEIVASAPQQGQPKKFEEMRAAEHHYEGRKIIENLSDIPTARKHLIEARRLYLAIPADSREYSYAQVSLRDIDKTEQQLRQLEILGNSLEVVTSVWDRNRAGKVAVWNLTLKNNSTKPIGNIQYRTEYISAGDRTMQVGGIDTVMVGEDHTIRQIVPPGSSRTIEINDVPVNQFDPSVPKDQYAVKAKFGLVAWEFVADAKGK